MCWISAARFAALGTCVLGKCSTVSKQLRGIIGTSILRSACGFREKGSCSGMSRIRLFGFISEPL